MATGNMIPVRPAARTYVTANKEVRYDIVRATSLRQPTDESSVQGDAKVPDSEAPGVDREVCVEAGWNKFAVRSIKRSLQRRYVPC